MYRGQQFIESAKMLFQSSKKSTENPIGESGILSELKKLERFETLWNVLERFGTLWYIDKEKFLFYVKVEQVGKA